MIQDAIAQILDGESLDRSQAYAVMDEIMRGDATQAQIAGFLVALRAKGETTDAGRRDNSARRGEAESMGGMIDVTPH